MKGTNIKGFFLVIIVSSCVYSQEAASQNAKKKNNIETSRCLELLKEYQHFWIRDSLAKNGFRELFSREFLKNCDFTGLKWSELEKYFGKPRSISKYEDNSTLYQYRVNNYRDHLDQPLDKPGNLLIWIEVKNNIITRFKLHEIDG